MYEAKAPWCSPVRPVVLQGISMSISAESNEAAAGQPVGVSWRCHSQKNTNDNGGEGTS